jgi:hypothetical protein
MVTDQGVSGGTGLGQRTELCRWDRQDTTASKKPLPVIKQLRNGGGLLRRQKLGSRRWEGHHRVLHLIQVPMAAVTNYCEPSELMSASALEPT